VESELTGDCSREASVVQDDRDVDIKASTLRFAVEEIEQERSDILAANSAKVSGSQTFFQEPIVKCWI
jgi:hypothetical protein